MTRTNFSKNIAANGYAQLNGTARELGYRMPAEWEPIECVWVTRPHNKETWPGCLDAAQQQFDNLVTQINQHAKVRTTQSLEIPTNDSWIRDYGPIFVTRNNNDLACHDFIFNCWGEKYEPYRDDDAVPRAIAKHLGISVWLHDDFVLEGGSIDLNGNGTLMTTRQCLLNKNRNPRLSQDEIETKLSETLSISHVIWLPGGINGDDTDGHIDDVARFIQPDTIAAAQAPAGHPDHDTLEKNWQALQQARNENGERLNLVALPCPEPVYYDFPPEDNTSVLANTALGIPIPEASGIPSGLKPVPASYANFLIANNAVFVPIFGQHSDDTALRVLNDAMPEYTIIGVRAEHLVVGLGGIHCLTMQQPKTVSSIK